MIHRSCVPLGRRDSEICGSAKLSTVLSIDTSSTGSMSTASANQRPAAPRTGPRVVDACGAGEVGVVVGVVVTGVVTARVLPRHSWRSGRRGGVELPNRPDGTVTTPGRVLIRAAV